MIENLSITEFIKTKYRDFALYTLTSRGIPAFEDSLTPVQRIILLNAPKKFEKSLKLIGDCFSNGYHHGDCLDYNTEILLADKTTIKIGEWFENNKDINLLVYCFDENNKLTISEASNPRIGQETNEYYEIELENGEIIKCTENHPFLINNEWVKAKNLKILDDIKNI